MFGGKMALKCLHMCIVASTIYVTKRFFQTLEENLLESVGIKRVHENIRFVAWKTASMHRQKPLRNPKSWFLTFKFRQIGSEQSTAVKFHRIYHLLICGTSIGLFFSPLWAMLAIP